jgi:hypothetical protein
MGDMISCPFVYANGKQCGGSVSGARAYGPRGKHGHPERHRVKKYRFWCTAGWDHAGAVSGPLSKERMEFYPDQLPEGLEDELWKSGFFS